MGSWVGAWRARSLFAAPARTRWVTPRWLWWLPAAVAVLVGVMLGLRALGFRSAGVFDALTDPSQALIPAVFLASILIATWLYGRARGLAGRVIGVLTVSAFAVSAVLLGYVTYVNCTPGEPPFFGPLILVLGGNGAEPWGNGPGCPEAAPLAHHVARLCAVWGALGGLLGVALAALRRQIDRWLASRSTRAVLVLGKADEKGRLVAVLDAHRGPDTDLIVVDQGSDEALLASLRQLGARVVSTEAFDDVLLTQMLTRRGKVSVESVHIVDPRVPESLSLFTRVAKVLDAARPNDALVPRVMVRIDDPWAAENWRRSNVVGERVWLTDALSATEQTAQALVARMESAATDRLVLSGDGELAEAVLAELAQHQREHRVLNLNRAAELSVVLVDPDAGSLALGHAVSEAAFGNEPASALQVRAEVPTDDQLADAAGEGPGAFLVLTEADPETNRPTRLAGRLPEATIWAIDPTSSTLPDQPVLGRLSSFGTGLIPGDLPPEDHWTRLARLLHNAYLGTLGEDADPRPSARPWSELPIFYRTSNLRQVQSLLSGVILLGRTWSGGGDDPLDEDELTFLGRREHESWRGFLEANGWRQAAVRDDASLRHPWLVDWSALPVEARERTLGGIRHAVALLATAGYRSSQRRTATAFRRRGEVIAERLTQAWSWRTESGAAMTAAAGDWRLLDPTTGRRWSVASAAFDSTHEAIGNGRYRRTGGVTARPAQLAERVQTLEGEAVARPGEWLVTGALGEQWLVPAERFREAYEPL